MPVPVLVSAMVLPAALASAALPADTRPAAPRSNSGTAVAPATRPAHFPHRIWAANDFEVRLPDYGWFGKAETVNIPGYAGNTTACRGEDLAPSMAALKTGTNPVPGPRMGGHNQLYLRYYLEGTDRATFQHYSLSSSDNCHIAASGLRQGRWSETVLDFTRDSRRNDGKGGAFEEGERMDDFQVYVGPPGQKGRYQVLIDDVIFFDDDPSGPPEPEAFPRRVIFLAAFDTGTDARSRPKYWPGRFDLVADRDAPAGSWWGVARAVAPAEGEPPCAALEMKPPRHVGADTKLRVRCWLKGGTDLRITLHDATAGTDRTVTLEGLPQGQWVTRYATFSRSGLTPAGRAFPAGNEVDSLTFAAPTAGADLYIDEVVLFDAAGAAAASSAASTRSADPGQAGP